ncbi:MAG: hypothetical protein ACLTG7_07200 [Romboutsia sp.]
MKKAEEYNINLKEFSIDPLVEMLCTSEDGIAMNVEVISKLEKISYNPYNCGCK